jgi:ribosomal protein S18 acetylase RimI-like enzyme
MRNHDGDEKASRAVGLRPANAKDEEFLLNLFISTRSDEFRLVTLEKKQKEALIAMQFKAQSGQFFMSYPQAQNSIILWNGDPIGRILIDRGETEFTLVDIALLPAHRNRGIGTALLKDLITEAANAGRPIRLHVVSSNSAKRLYERLGFCQVGGDAAYVEMRWAPGGLLNPNGTR